MTLQGFLGDVWDNLNSSEGWGNWFESITRVYKSWHKVTQRRRSNPSFIAVCDYLWGARGGLTSETRILREIKTSHNTYTQLQSICVGKEAINTKTQAHELINTLCDLTPTLKQLQLLGTETEIELRAAKSLAIRGLALRDSIELVTWLHGLPVTGAKGFLNLMRDSPRATVLHVLEGCEQIALLNLVTQGYLPETPLREFGGHPVGHQQVPFVLVFDLELFPRLTYMQNLLTHIKQGSVDCPKTTLNIITYEPLTDNGEGRLPRRRPFSTHPEFRPTVKRCRGEPPDKNLGYDDLVELYGYDEERGLSTLALEKGTKIEIPYTDEYGVIAWRDGRVSSTTQGSLTFKVRFPGSDMDHDNWTLTRSRADMESTWRLAPATRKRQQGVYAILSTQGYTPWHHSHHGSHWLRLQPRGAWKYKTHNVHGSLQDDIFGWRIGLSMMHIDDYIAGGTEFTINEFTMCSFAEDHMSKEDLGVGASTQEWADLQNLGRELMRWDNLPMDSQARNKWSQVPPRVPDKKEPRPRSRGRKDRGKGISCFLGSTRVRMATVDALRIIVKYCKMTGVVCDIGDALVDGECATANVNDVLAKCEVVSLSVHHQRKIESQRLGEKQKAACDLHDGSVPCVVCKGKISDYGYRQHCIQCYIDLFPGIRHEEVVRGVIDANFEGFVHNKVMKGIGRDNECRRKIYHRLQIGNTILAIETDERAHADRNQEDEKRRYNEFTSNFPHKFVFIRFNPHTNMEDKLAETDFKHKLGVLMRSIKSQMLRIQGSNVKELEIFTLFCG